MTLTFDISVSEPRGGSVGYRATRRVAVIGSPTRATDQLVAAWRRAGIDASVLTPADALATLGPGDVALYRLDVLPTLDGVEPGLDTFPALAARGVRVLNPPDALLATHDKLRTAHVLAAAGIWHPRTLHVTGRPLPEQVPLPCVVKPRFGSWGTDVVLCATRHDLDVALAAVASRPWWRLHGALVQELVPPAGRDLRLLVAGGEVVGGALRVAAAGEWRTNVSVGGQLEPVDPPADAVAEAARAAQALGIDLAGVDLLPCGGGWVVLELNGAVDFDVRYELAGRDLYEAIAGVLGLSLPRSPQPRSVNTLMAAPAAAGTMDSTHKEGTIMITTLEGLPAAVGDRINITGHVVGDSPRAAEILEVLGEPGHEHFRVRWEDGHESIYFPAEDAVIRRPKA